MDYSNIDKGFIADFNIDSIFATQQTWTKSRQVFHREQPRSQHGLLYFSNEPAEYELPDGSFVRAEVGDVLLLPKGSCYTTNFLMSEDHVSHPIMINFRMTDMEGKEILLGDRVARIPRGKEEMFPLFNMAAEFYKEASLIQLKAVVYHILARLFPVYQEDECCIGYINNNYTKQFFIGDLAKKASMSETAYRKRFRDLTGDSPLRYINRLKMEKACEMLINSDVKPREISEYLNFYSLQYFYRMFKQHVKMTPQEYRKRMIK